MGTSAKLSEEDLEAEVRTLLLQADANQDGKIDFGEFGAFLSVSVGLLFGAQPH